MRKEQIAWAAGLFEGEGTISLTQNRRYKHPRPQLLIQMVDFDLIRKFKRTVKSRKYFLSKKKNEIREESFNMVVFWQS